MTRMAGDAMKGMSFGQDQDTIEFEDGEKIHKDDVAQYVSDNYKKNDKGFRVPTAKDFAPS